MHPFLSRFHLGVLRIILYGRFVIFVRAYMLEIVAIILIVITIPLWLPLVTGIIMSLISFGFMAILWLVFILAVIYLLLV